MNRSTDAWRATTAALLALVLAACGTAPPKPTDPAPEPVEEGSVGPSPEERYAAALDLLRRNQLGPAQEAFEALTRELPEKSGPWTNLGLIHYRNRRWPDARAALEAAVRANPRNAEAHNQLGMVLRELRDYPRARQAYEAALSVQPDLASAHLNLGLLMDMHLNAPQEALTHYRRYLALGNEDDLRVYVWIAEIERRGAAVATGEAR